MNHVLWTFLLVVGEMIVFTEQQTSSVLDTFLTDCSAQKDEYVGRCGGKRCFGLNIQYTFCGLQEFLDQIVIIETDVDMLNVTLINLSNAFDLAQEELLVHLENIYGTFTTVSLNMSRIESEAAAANGDLMTSISTTNGEIQNMMPLIQMLNTSQEGASTEIAFLSMQQMNTSALLALISTQVDSQGDQIQELYQSLNTQDSSIDEINEALNGVILRTDNLETWQQCAENETQCLRNDVDCLQESYAENTATIANLTLLLDLLTNDIVSPAISSLNLLPTMSDMSNLTSDLACLREDLQNETLQREQLCAIVEDLNCTINEMSQMFALVNQTQLEMAETCCNVSEKLCALEDSVAEQGEIIQNQTTRISELENCVAEQGEMIENQTARICDLETSIEVYEENITCLSDRIDALEIMVLELTEQVSRLLNQSNPTGTNLEAQLEEMNCTLTTAMNDLCTQQELVAELTSEMNCTLTEHETRLCTLEAQICNPDCGNTTIGTVQGSDTTGTGSTTGSPGSDTTGTGITTVGPGSGTGTTTGSPGSGTGTTTGSPGPATTSTGITTVGPGSDTTGTGITTAAPVVCEQLCSKVDELGLKVNALDAKLPDCPIGFIAMYRDPEHEIPPLCLKFEMKSEDFCTHEYHCQLQGLHLVEPIGNYTMCQLEDYINSMPVLQDCSFFVGGTDRDAEGEWKWLSGDPMTCDWLDGEPSGGTDLNCASLDTTNFGLESCSCDSKSFAICQI